MALPTGIADYLTGFSTGWPEDTPELMILKLSTHKGVHDYAITKEQALLIAKTLNDTAAHLKEPKTSSS